MLILSLSWLIVVLILIARALRQRAFFRDIPKRPGADVDARSVAIIVPARNEAENIERCLESLLHQSFPLRRYRIIAVDDNSTDGTADLIMKIESPPRLFLKRAPPLPAGWTGKSHACWIAAAKAAGESEWLCFIDADVEASRDLLATALSLAIAENIDYLSLAPRQRLESFSERLVMPCGFYLLAFSQRLQDVNSPLSKVAAATGQFILIRSTVYKALGGHQAVRGDICEDLALAKLAKSAGHRVALFGGMQLLNTRMYTGWRTLWPGITKNLTAMLGGPIRTIVAALIALSLAWAAPLLPALAALQCSRSTSSCIALAAALPASLAAFGLHISGTVFFRIPFWYGLIFPLGYTVGAGLAFDSVRRDLTGKIRWKGRTYS